LGHYEERGLLDAWLRRVTVRVALMRQRTRERQRETPLQSAGDLSDPNATRPELFELQTAVDALPAPLRQVLVLKEMEGYSHAEIAALLGISAVTSRVRLYRALRTVRQRLEDH
jgi:RNA polymerase sigma-70 factor (ECF subfamily)